MIKQPEPAVLHKSGQTDSPSRDQEPHEKTINRRYTNVPGPARSSADRMWPPRKEHFANGH